MALGAHNIIVPFCNITKRARYLSDPFPLNFQPDPTKTVASPVYDKYLFKPQLNTLRESSLQCSDKVQVLQFSAIPLFCEERVRMV